MSFQSLLEGGECGSTNPVVDLARQFTAPVVVNNVSTGVAAAVLNQNPNLVDSVPFSAAADLLQENAPISNPFNMESLLEQMSHMENLFDQNAAPNPIAKPKEDSLPLISNAPASIEEEFWADAIRTSVSAEDNVFSSFQTQSSISDLFDDNNWADEYFRQLSSSSTDQQSINNNNHKINFNSFENQLEQKENDTELTNSDAYRNQPVTNTSFDSFQSYGPFSSFQNQTNPINLPEFEAPIVNDNGINMKDLVSDQEQRLMNMLLGCNLSGECGPQNVETTVPQPSLASTLNSESIVDFKTDSELKPADLNPLNEQQESEQKQQESFFYENQFDDMEFWIKLAEDWESSKVDDDSKKSLSDAFQDDTFQSQNDQIQNQNPLKHILNSKHAQEYQFVANNPFLPAAESEEQQDTQKPDYIAQGIKRLEIGDLSTAVFLFEAAVQSEPENVKAWQLLGLSQAKNENDFKAIAAMKRCLALDQINLDALMCLAISFTNESMPTESCYALQEWLRNNEKYKHLVPEIVPKSIDSQSQNNSEQYMGPTPLSKRWGSANKSLIRSYTFSDGFFESVLKSFMDAAVQSPDNPDADVQCGLGVLFSLNGDFDRAADCFKTAVSVHQDDHCLWNRLGATLANGGRSEEAMSAYREALVRYPGFIRARYNLGISCILLDQATEAIQHLLAVLNLQQSAFETIGYIPEIRANLSRAHITSANVWSTLRSALMLINRSDLYEAINQRNLQMLNKVFEFSLNPVRRSEQQSSIDGTVGPATESQPI